MRIRRALRQRLRDGSRRATWLAHAYTLAEKDYATWERPEHKAGTTGLSRYWDFGSGPVPEMADDSTYYTDVIRWLVAHPHEGGDGFLVKGCGASRCSGGGKAEADELRCARERGVRAGVVRRLPAEPRVLCGRPGDARVGVRYRESLWAVLRSDRGVCAGLPEQPALSLRARPGTPGAAAGQRRDAAALGPAVAAAGGGDSALFVAGEGGVFADFNFVHAKSSSYAFIASLYPLWAGVATREEATAMEAKLNLFERAGGLSTSNTNTGLQWDEPLRLGADELDCGGGAGGVRISRGCGAHCGAL